MNDTTAPGRLTPYGDLDALLADLLAGAQAVLGERLVGLYLHGSLAAGDFDPTRSDVDFVAATAGRLSADDCAALAAMHRRLAERHSWAARLEGSYIPCEALRRYDPADTVYPALRIGGEFALDGHGMEWVIQRHVLREHGLALYGPNPAGLVDAVPLAALQAAALATLREWWAPQLDDPHRLHEAEYQAYATLTMCRALYTLANGEVATKPTAARWAQAVLGPPWADLIARAMAWRLGQPFDALEDVLELIRVTLRRGDEWAAGRVAT